MQVQDADAGRRTLIDNRWLMKQDQAPGTWGGPALPAGHRGHLQPEVRAGTAGVTDRPARGACGAAARQTGRPSRPGEEPGHHREVV